MEKLIEQKNYKLQDVQNITNDRGNGALDFPDVD
jgi:hypothetical protein